ncbi:mitochondrial carrier, iron ion Mrs3 [Schizosaccharomyces osmophilus]|uniref:Mitochondrial carrier, iron ion Mrs3 n=1 Tax=Schizosaccharomyces osmophilus TaxID=2545709 RepID=A0AAE9WDW7_9SCHI|nr:mitochondrial carrier, iron ion Mrs3 [Schizosaccharomyces osmophilus]WBW73839.1 mitochondrial carrier, iron ion Mrs3 [Schizosaccharomyces osmophilus]
MTYPAEDFDYEGLPENSPMYAHLLAGAFSGILEHSVMYPVDAIKTRMQMLNGVSRSATGNVVASAYKIGSTEGVFSLWRGISSVIMGAGPSHAIYFSVLEMFKSKFNASSDRPLITALAGACAITISDAFMTPFDVIKQRMQLPTTNYKSPIQCASTLFRREGVSAFYISYPTSIAMSIPYTAIQVGSYDVAMSFCNPSGIYNPVSHIISGALSGAIAASLTTPLDVVKTLLQTRGSSTIQQVKDCRGSLNAIRVIYNFGGLSAFVKGIKPRVIVSMPATAVSWAAYEAGKEILSQVSNPPEV